MSELGYKRQLFTRCFALLLTRMIFAGYRPMVGRDGLKHMDLSLHFDGLAKDIDLCDSQGKYLEGAEAVEAHRPFGLFWESLHPDCYWGGDGTKVDGLKHDANHYSVTFGGRK
jgi:hypothetical protein